MKWDMWTGWPVQTLILVSFVLQVLLFVLAGFRRRSASTVLRVILWLAYLGSDSVATYTLGHLSIAASQDHLLVAIWAPLLLLHLGGQDTITAYALEDNQLWLRHLQTLGVQVLAAAYIILGYVPEGGWALLSATVLMFLVGAARYGERIWALKCASNDGIYSFLISYCKQESPPAVQEHDAHVERGKYLLDLLGTEEEKVMYGAHSLLGISMCMLLDREEETCRHNNGALSVLAYLFSAPDANNPDMISTYSVIEKELSLIYDIMYTKARVIHTPYGLCIRVASLLTIFSTGILMYLFVIKEGTPDARMTYFLLAGAFLIDLASGFVAMVSTWTRHNLYRGGNRSKYYNVVVYLRRLIKAGSWRSWSGTVGQFNMIEHCARAEAPFRVTDYICGLPLRQDENLSGLTPPVQVSARIKDMISTVISSVAEKYQGAAESMYALVRSRELLDDNYNFDRKVIIWHIATHLILDSITELGGIQEQITAIKTLSDYMMFLLIEQPDMMPGHTRRNLYMEAIESLKGLRHQDYAEHDDYAIARRLLAEGREVLAGGDTRFNGACMKGARLALTLLGNGREASGLLDEMFRIWVEMLCYAGNQCTRDSHARRLSSGGEFLTVVWLLAGHFADYERFKQQLTDSTV